MDGVSFVNRINTLLKQKSKTKNEFYADLNLSNNSITAWGKKNQIPSVDVALKIANYLKSNKRIANVNYPLIPENPSYELAKKYFTKGGSSLVTFTIKDGKEKAIKLIENVKVFVHATNIGDARSIITYPSLTTHRQLNDQELIKCGISNTFIRLSIGLEDVDDLIEDLDNALK